MDFLVRLKNTWFRETLKQKRRHVSSTVVTGRNVSSTDRSIVLASCWKIFFYFVRNSAQLFRAYDESITCTIFWTVAKYRHAHYGYELSYTLREDEASRVSMINKGQSLLSNCETLQNVVIERLHHLFLLLPKDLLLFFYLNCYYCRRR